MPQWQLGPGESQLVSYIVPAYNADKYIGEALESCLAQDYRPLEVVVVDDGSTDNTAAAVRQFGSEQENGRFRIVYLLQENAGPSAARNNGLLNSRGEAIGFLDADDLIPPGRTTLLYGALVSGGTGVAYGTHKSVRTKEDAARLLKESRRSAGVVCVPEWEDVSSFPPIKFVPGLCNFLMHRALAERTGPLSEDFINAEDFEYIVRLRLQSPKVLRTREVVHFYRKTPGSITGTPKPINARDRLLSAKTVLEHVDTFNISDAESLLRLHWRFRRAAIECLRHGLKSESAEAYNLSTGLASGRARIFCKSAALLCMIPFSVPLFSWAIWLRTTLWLPLRRVASVRR